jgi:hypothetical protein
MIGRSTHEYLLCACAMNAAKRPKLEVTAFVVPEPDFLCPVLLASDVVQFDDICGNHVIVQH